MSSHSPFLVIPHELAEHILSFCHARDVARIAQTCRDMHELIYSDRDSHLWRELYLQSFDDPRKSVILSMQDSSEEIDWRGDLQLRVQAERIMRTDPASLQDRGHLVVRALTTLASVIDSALPASPAGDDVKSANLAWAYDLLVNSPLVNDTSLHSAYRDVLQLQARFRCYLALSHEDAESNESDSRLIALRTVSRCFVYDLRKYTHETRWGPYLALQGEILPNWVHLEHIMNVIVMNIREVPNYWEDVWPKWGLEATRAYSATNVRNRNPRDWAGVEGLWRRVVCFMDYRDLFTFNFLTTNGGPHNPAYFSSEPRFAEAVRLMELELYLKDDPEPDADSTSEPGSNARFPTLHFEGNCHGAHNSSGLVEGTVRVCASGAVCWNFVTAYDGSVNSWSAEGVQIGNVGSAMGIAGIWSVALHEEVGDPAGPFWMWKADETLPRDMFLIPVF